MTVWGARTRAACRRLVCVHTFDVVGRKTADMHLEGAQPFELRRLEAMDPLLRSARSERDWPIFRPVVRIPIVARAMRRARARRHERRFGRGEVAYVAVSNGEPAAWAWVSSAAEVHCRWSGLHFHLDPGEAYLFDLWSFPEERRRGAGAFVMRGAIEDLHDSGRADHVYGYILRSNRPSQVLHRLVLGFEQVQQVRSIRLLSRVALQLPRTDHPASGPCSPRRAMARPRAVA